MYWIASTVAYSLSVHTYLHDDGGDELVLEQLVLFHLFACKMEKRNITHYGTKQYNSVSYSGQVP